MFLKNILKITGLNIDINTWLINLLGTFKVNIMFLKNYNQKFKSKLILFSQESWQNLHLDY